MVVGRGLLRSLLVLPLAALYLVPADGHGAAAQSYFREGESRASKLMVNRTQTRILKVEDRAAPACADKVFLDAVIVKAPEVTRKKPSVIETKWQEFWRVDRCGDTVGYWVFFTEVGGGGSYFSILSQE